MYEIIQGLCKANGITITALCEKITGSKGNLSTWKKNNIRNDYLIKISEYFNVSTDYLLGNENKNALASEDTEARELYRLFKALPEAQQKAIELLLKQKLDK